MTALKSVWARREAVDADLGEVRNGLRDVNDLVQHEYQAQDICHRHLDKLASMLAGQFDRAKVSEIWNHFVAGGS